jgi:hypothetical protein
MAALVMDKLTALDITRQPLSKLQILLIETEVTHKILFLYVW